MEKDSHMINLYRIKYSITPIRSVKKRRRRTGRKARVMRGVRRVPGHSLKLKKNRIRSPYAMACRRCGHSGRTNKVLLVVKDNVPIESYLLECIPPLPERSKIIINSIENISSNTTTNNDSLQGGQNE